MTQPSFSSNRRSTAPERKTGAPGDRDDGPAAGRGTSRTGGRGPRSRIRRRLTAIENGHFEKASGPARMALSQNSDRRWRRRGGPGRANRPGSFPRRRGRPGPSGRARPRRAPPRLSASAAGQVSPRAFSMTWTSEPHRPKPPLAHSGGSLIAPGDGGHGLVERPGHRGLGHPPSAGPPWPSAPRPGLTMSDFRARRGPAGPGLPRRAGGRFGELGEALEPLLERPPGLPFGPGRPRKR